MELKKMNINPTSAFGFYKLNSAKTAKPSAARAKEGKANQDTISISPDASLQRELDEAVKLTAREMQGVDAGRLNGIREAVENGSYYVPTDKLADAILEHAFGYAPGM